MGCDADRLRELVSEVAAAYFSHSQVSPSEIPMVVEKIASSLSAVGLSKTHEPEHKDAEQSGPIIDPATIDNSIQPNGIVSFEDGRTYKMLKRHLTDIGMTPSQYRRKWSLPPDYPMVAPNLSALRSELARSRLGKPIGEPISGNQIVNQQKRKKKPSPN